MVPSKVQALNHPWKGNVAHQSSFSPHIALFLCNLKSRIRKTTHWKWSCLNISTQAWFQVACIRVAFPPGRVPRPFQGTCSRRWELGQWLMMLKRHGICTRLEKGLVAQIKVKHITARLVELSEPSPVFLPFLLSSLILFPSLNNNKTTTTTKILYLLCVIIPSYIHQFPFHIICMGIALIIQHEGKFKYR